MKRMLVALLCIGSCSIAAAEELKLTTVFDKTAFFRGEPVTVWLVAENRSADTMIISAGAWPIGQSFEVVDEHGKPLRYIGAVVQRVSGAVDETQIIRPGSRHVYAEILDYSYPMHLAGTYRVTATVQAARTLRPVTGRWKSSDGADLRTVRSEPQTITVTDINDPAVAIIKDCKGGWLGCINDYFVRHSGEPSRPRVQLTAPSILDPYIALARMRFLERPRDLRQWRTSFIKRFPAFDQPGLLWMNMAESADRYNLGGLDGLIEDAKRDPVMARHPALLVMERRKSLLLDEQKEATTR